MDVSGNETSLIRPTRYTHMHEKPRGFASICIVIRPIISS